MTQDEHVASLWERIADIRDRIAVLRSAPDVRFDEALARLRLRSPTSAADSSPAVRVGDRGHLAIDGDGIIFGGVLFDDGRLP